MTRTSPKIAPGQRRAGTLLGLVLLGLCLCLVALRATYTEAPIAQTFTVPGGLTDTLYSLIISGVLVLAFLLWFLVQMLRGTVTCRTTGIGIGLSLFLLASVISTVGAADKRLAITQVAIVLGPILGAILLIQLLDSIARIRLVLLVVAALGVVSTYQCAEQRFISNEVMVEQYEQAPEILLEPFGIEPGTFQHFLFEHRLYSRGVRGFFTTSNSAASFGLMASFAALALLTGHLGKGKRFLGRLACQPYQAAGAAIVIVGLLLTQSKGGILGFALAAVLFGFWVAMRRWLSTYRTTVLYVSLALGLAATVAAGSMVASYGLKHGRLPGGNSMLVRWQYWRASARMFADKPMGVGAGNFADTYPKYKPAAAPESVADPHNFPLSLLTQYGPLGLAGFLLMVIVPLWRSSAKPTLESPSDSDDPTTSKRMSVIMMLAVVAALLALRPVLIPTSGGGPDLLMYEILVLYIAPAAAFLVGFLLLAHSKSASPNPENPDTGIIRAALGSAVLGVLVHNLIDFAIFEPGVWTTLWVIIACLVATGQRQASAVPRTIPVGRPLKLATGVVTLVTMALYAHYVVGPVYYTTTAIQQAQKAMALGHFNRAHSLLDAAAMADPLSPVPLNLSGRLYLQEYDLTGARETTVLERAAVSFIRATQVNPDDYRNYEKAAIAYRRLGRHSEAFDWYGKAAGRYPGCGRLWFGLAQAADHLGRTDRARESYLKTIQIEDAFREQFRMMYPAHGRVVSRLGEESYLLAKKRLAELSI